MRNRDVIPGILIYAHFIHTFYLHLNTTNISFINAKLINEVKSKYWDIPIVAMVTQKPNNSLSNPVTKGYNRLLISLRITNELNMIKDEYEQYINAYIYTFVLLHQFYSP